MLGMKRESQTATEEMMTDLVARRRAATARFMLRVIAAEKKAGIIRPDAKAFTARMKVQANAARTA